MDLKNTAIIMGASLGGYYLVHHYTEIGKKYLIALNQKDRENAILRNMINQRNAAPAHGGYNPDKPGDLRYAGKIRRLAGYAPGFGDISAEQREQIFGMNQGVKTINSLPTSPAVAERQRRYGAMQIPGEPTCFNTVPCPSEPCFEQIPCPPAAPFPGMLRAGFTSPAVAERERKFGFSGGSRASSNLAEWANML